MISLNHFMVLVKKTPFHFNRFKQEFDLNEALNFYLKSRFSFGKRYAMIDGRNIAEREKSKESAIKCGLIPYEKSKRPIIEDMAKTIKAIELLSKFKAEDYEVNGIDFTIPLISHERGQEFLVCVKTTRDASDAFENEIIRQKHYVEVALMRQAVGNHYDCLILAIETDTPHAYSFFKIDDSLLNQGDAEISEKIKLLNECNSKNFYPSYFGGGAKTITKPSYL